VVVVPDGGGEGEDALPDPGDDACFGASAVLFEVELAFEGVVDRFDDLAQRFEVPGAGAFGFAFAGWAEQVPPDFRFAVRLPRLITHGSRVGLAGTFCERARLLGQKLGPVLVVLDRPRDDGFLTLLLGSLEPELEYAFDLRHESWAGGDVPVRVNSLEGEAPFRYLRLREPPYDDASLRDWAARLRPLR